MSFDPLAGTIAGWNRSSRETSCNAAAPRFSNHVGNAQNVLIAGEGNGRFLVECRRKLPSAQITLVERQRPDARRGARPTGTLRTGLARRSICSLADALTWRPESASHDLVVTHFFLDCFPGYNWSGRDPASPAVPAPGAAWLLADFQVPVRGPAAL